MLPVYKGEIQCRGLGMDVDCFDNEGNSQLNEQGELVCKSPFPSMPVYFWNDPDGAKFHKAYFNDYPDTWHHGDFILINDRGGVIILGRSDATLNPGGVRIGTSEIYRVIENLEEIEDCVVVGQKYKDDERVVLFVKPVLNYELTGDLVQRIKSEIRTKCSPRHVPAIIQEVPEIPYTKNGKRVEIAVKQIVNRKEVNNKDALANPYCLDYYEDIINELDNSITKS